MSVESSCVGILQALFASGICRPGARTVKFESGFYCYHHFLPFSSFLFMKQPGLYLLVDYQSPFHLILSRVCTMRPFFLNFLADTFKNCEISLPVGKKYILYHYSIIIFPFLTPKIPQNEKMSLSQQPMVLRSSITTQFNGNMHVSIRVSYRLNL